MLLRFTVVCPLLPTFLQLLCLSSYPSYSWPHPVRLLAEKKGLPIYCGGQCETFQGRGFWPKCKMPATKLAVSWL